MSKKKKTIVAGGAAAAVVAAASGTFLANDEESTDSRVFISDENESSNDQVTEGETIKTQSTSKRKSANSKNDESATISDEEIVNTIQVQINELKNTIQNI